MKPMPAAFASIAIRIRLTFLFSQHGTMDASFKLLMIWKQHETRLQLAAWNGAGPTTTSSRTSVWD
jgi:hypothetical protein